MRLIYKKISCIVLSLAIVFSFMPWINADSINIHASTSEGLESWNVSATGVNSGTTRTYDLTLEKKVDNEYVLYIPDDILCTANKSSISIYSPIKSNVHSTGSYAGGIIARGYDDITAPNTPVVTVSNCFVSGTVTGVDYVGGILGAEPTCEDCWSNGVGGVYNSCFYGDVKATDGANIGAVIGFLRSYNKYQNIADNTYEKGCGADRAIGKIQEIIDTNHPKYGNHGIEPGSFDADSGGILVDDIKNDDVVFKLNNGSQSLKNWIKSDSGYPILSKIPVAYKLVLDGEYKTDYFVGDSFDSSGMVVKAIYSDGTINSVSVDEVEISGFDTSSKGVKTVKISYGVASTIYKIRVVEAQPKDVSVSFTLYGDKVHKSDLDGYTHTKG